MAGSTLKAGVAYISPVSGVVNPTDALLAGTNATCLQKAKKTGVCTDLRNHKTADLPLLLGAELAA